MTTTETELTTRHRGRRVDARRTRMPSLAGILSTMLDLLAGTPHACLGLKVRKLGGRAVSSVGRSMEDQRDPVIRCDGPCL